MKHIIVVFIWLLSSHLIAYAQNCENIIQGSILDFHDGTPLAGATIYIKTQKRYTTSDIDGNFTIQNICRGKLTLTISHLGCENKHLEMDVRGNMYKKINMEHHLEQLNEVSITNRVNKTATTAQEKTINKNILKRYSNLSLGDALKEIAGVSSINTGSTIVKPIINGLHSSRVLIFNNGVRLQDQEWGIEHAPNIDINSINQIHVIKGSLALAYGGDAIGGVVITKPNKVIRKDTLYGKTTTGTQSNGRGYYTSSSINKNYKSGWFTQVQISSKKIGDLEAPKHNLTNSGINSKGITARFGKNKFESGFNIFYSYIDNEIGILSASRVGSIFDLSRAINSGSPSVNRPFSYKINAPKQDIKHHLSKIKYYKRFENLGKLSLQYDYQNNKRLEFDVRIGDRRLIPAINLKLQTHTALAHLNLDSNLDQKLNIGLSAGYQNNFANPNTGVRRLIPDYNKYNFSIYSTIEKRLNSNLVIDAGLRYDLNRIDAKKFYRRSRWEERGYNSEFSNIIIERLPTQFLTNPIFTYHNLSASLGFKVYLNNHSHVLGNYALASRPPNPAELFSDGLHQSVARFELGDIRFNKETSNRLSASYNYNTSKVKLSIETFYNKIKDYIYLRPFNFISTLRGPFPLWEYQQTNAQLYGIDISTTYTITNKWQYQNKLAYVKGKDVSNNIALIDIPPFNTTNQIVYHSKSWYNFLASLKINSVFKQNEYPNFNFDVQNPSNNSLTTIDISTPPPAYNLLHFYSEATFNFNKKTTLNIALGVNNILNTTYRNYLNQLRFFTDEAGRNITLKFQLNY